MEKCYYLARDGKVVGPYSETQLRQFAGANRLAATDMVQKAGSGIWQPIPEFFAGLPGAQISAAKSVEPARQMGVTCLACYTDVFIQVEPGKHSAICPKCRNEILLETETKPAQATNRAFEGVGGTLTERIQRKMQEAAEAEPNLRLPTLDEAIDILKDM
jgi:hypothetical protein